MDRFDNYSIEFLHDLDRERWREWMEVQSAIFERLIRECPIKISHSYRIVSPSRFAGRLILVMGIVKEADNSFRRLGEDGEVRGEPCRLAISGPLNSKTSIAGDGWTIKYQKVNPDYLDLLSETPCNARKRS